MLVNGKRALAYIVRVEEIKPLDGYDRVEYARNQGWWCIVSKEDGFNVGDKAVYFEIDSKVPASDKRFAFMEKRKWHVKCQKMCKVVSQGLLLPMKLFPELDDADIGTDVTEKLGITYYEPEDNIRKSSSASSGDKYSRMARKHPGIFNKKPVRWLMRRRFGKYVLYAIFGWWAKDTRGKWAFPDFVSKTDEERIENLPHRVGDGEVYVQTEKLDGTSCTYALKRKPFGRYEFFVCSRNVRQMDENQKTYHDHNIYWDMAFKYDIERHLREYLETHSDCNWVCIQGEGVGSVQGNPLKLKEDDLYVFNFITSVRGRTGSFDGRDIVTSWGMKWVPIIGVAKTQDTLEEMKKYADGMSVINPEVRREGIVYRSMDGRISFKNVSVAYLMSKKD